MTPQQIRGRAAAGVIAGAFAVCGCGCGSGDDVAERPTPTGTPAATATAEPSAAVPALLRGRWRRTMTARDWSASGGGFPAGTFRLDVGADGAVSVYFPHADTVDFTTRFVVRGHRLTIEDVPICPGETARYTWRASSRELGLAVVGEDACRPRAALFGGTWTHRH